MAKLSIVNITRKSKPKTHLADGFAFYLWSDNHTIKTVKSVFISMLGILNILESDYYYYYY